jgi:TatD DNase family protein
MRLTDSHAHLDMYEDMSGDRTLAGVLERARTAGVERILAIGIGDGPETMHRALEIAEASATGARAGDGGPAIWASVGIHPQEAHHATPEALERLTKLARRERCVAVGEIGLDYYHADNPDAATQQEAFVAQLRVAAQVGKPILIHCRTSELATPAAKARFAGSGPNAAWEDLLRLLEEHWSEAARPGMPAGIMHCFSGTLEQARRSLEMGFYLAFAGNVTYPAAKGIREAAAMAPADRILIETDAPFLAPIPHRGERNEPALIVHTATTLAGLRNVSLEEIAELTSANFTNLFPSAASPDH